MPLNKHMIKDTLLQNSQIRQQDRFPVRQQFSQTIILYLLILYYNNLDSSLIRHFGINQQLSPGSHNQQSIRMVRVKDFQGAVFHPEEYQAILRNNIQHLETTPMSKTFKTQQMLAQGKLYPEIQPFFYIYRQIYLNHTSFGILAEISLQDYHDNRIKKHEKTLNRPGLNHTTYAQDHVGPVVVSHRENKQLDQMILNLTKSNDIFCEWTTNDGRAHTLWKIKQNEVALAEKFKKIECLYILDGHHRLQAAHHNYLQSDKSNETDLWIQAIIYSSEYIMIHPQHRVIQNIPENILIINQLLKLSDIEVTDYVAQDLSNFDVNAELDNYEILLKLESKIYGINFKNASRNVLQKVSTFRLQHEIFKDHQGEQILKKLKYIPGIVNPQEILKHQIVFFVRQPKIQTLFQIADQSVTMPPKSTWIEPKPCSHMVIRLLKKTPSIKAQ